MMRWGWLLLVLAVGCGKTLPRGEVCEKPEQCGKGADCYRGVCTSMCANDSECEGELVCARHHCLLATGEPMRAGAIGLAPSVAYEKNEPTDARTPTAPTPPTEPNRPTQPPPTNRPTGTIEPMQPNVPPPPADPSENTTPGWRPGLRGGSQAVGPAPRNNDETVQRLQAEVEALRAEQKRLAEKIEALEKRR